MDAKVWWFVAVYSGAAALRAVLLLVALSTKRPWPRTVTWAAWELAARVPVHAGFAAWGAWLLWGR